MALSRAWSPQLLVNMASDDGDVLMSILESSDEVVDFREVEMEVDETASKPKPASDSDTLVVQATEEEEEEPNEEDGLQVSRPMQSNLQYVQRSQILTEC